MFAPAYVGRIRPSSNAFRCGEWGFAGSVRLVNWFADRGCSRVWMDLHGLVVTLASPWKPTLTPIALCRGAPCSHQRTWAEYDPLPMLSGVGSGASQICEVVRRPGMFTRLDASPRSCTLPCITLETYAYPYRALSGCPMFAPAYVGRIRPSSNA